jgi:hypothetical protein
MLIESLVNETVELCGYEGTYHGFKEELQPFLGHLCHSLTPVALATR